ncbi:MAG: UDP-N-acetylmuramoyl-tripeptide--D-alanyl-D-alanine ligase [Phycisphaera sp. TMED9]|nr:MAG: UDP-N-acetylmuramoyl-tripeptide--D-alanyl-D-alanine ligase [Phycisphaera sp. TMED9]
MIESNLDQIAEVVAGRVIGDGTCRFRGVGTDTRSELEGRLFIAIPGENHDGHDHLAAARAAGASAALIESGFVDRGGVLPEGFDVVMVPSVRPALAAMASAHRDTLEGVVIGITGSSGKTTVRAMAERVLALTGAGTASIRSFNNDLGVPLTILGASKDDAWLLLEIGTNAPGEIASLTAIAKPSIGIITGIGRAHLGGFGSEASIAAEKASMLDVIDEVPGGVAIINVDGSVIRPELARRRDSSLEIITCGETDDADRHLDGRAVLATGGQRIRIGEFEATLSLDGCHNAVNAIAVLELGRRLKIDDAAIARVFETLEPPAMRFVRHVVNGVLLIDDTYNANPESMTAALATFAEVAANAERRIVVLGAMYELGEMSQELHVELGERAAGVAGELVLVGESEATDMETGARASGFTGPVAKFTGVEEAAAFLGPRVRKGDAILFKGSRRVGLEVIVEGLTKPGEVRA